MCLGTEESLQIKGCSEVILTGRLLLHLKESVIHITADLRPVLCWAACPVWLQDVWCSTNTLAAGQTQPAHHDRRAYRQLPVGAAVTPPV